MFAQTIVSMANEVSDNLIVGNGGDNSKVGNEVSLALAGSDGFEWHSAMRSLASLATIRSTLGADMAVLTLHGIVFEAMTDGV